MEGMNGLELARKVHDKHPDVPVIIVTGYGPIDGGSDVDVCLSKEALFPDLLEKIKFYLAEADSVRKSQASQYFPNCGTRSHRSLIPAGSQAALRRVRQKFPPFTVPDYRLPFPLAPPHHQR